MHCLLMAVAPMMIQLALGAVGLRALVVAIKTVWRGSGARRRTSVC